MLQKLTILLICGVLATQLSACGTDPQPLPVSSSVSSDASASPPASVAASIAPSIPQSQPKPTLTVTAGGESLVLESGLESAHTFQVASLEHLPQLAGQEDATVVIQQDGQTVFDGTGTALKEFSPLRNDLYVYQVTPATGESYLFQVECKLPPQVRLSADGAPLGETLVLYVDYAEGLELSASTDLNYKPKFYAADGTQMALLPVSYYTQPGVYGLDITVGTESFHYEIQADARDFVIQNLEVDEDTTNETIDNDFANREWNEKIEPLKQITDGKKYWDGPFLMPVEGRITTEFGTIRYTNGSSNASRHGALDIAASTGTPVPASNAGRVIFAQYIQMSGNVVVIEHGLGLKTWYFHMDEIDVEEGAMVQKGEIIGKVGATGFVTGPHLHFGMSVNGVYIDPATAIEKGIQ